ncbi:MAG TPA: hypothetical protein VMY05_10170 [Acidobacteriota bacterium]|nr:hypothetical protein [Acidobacteriota bacterium]
MIREFSAKRLLARAAGVTVLLTMLYGCSDSFIGREPTEAVRLAFTVDDASPALEAALGLFEVTVTDPRTGEILAKAPLTLTGRFLEGTIDSLPAGRLLKFRVAAIDNRIGLTVYAGTAEAVLSSGSINTITIRLRAQVPLLKFTPRYVLLEDSPSFAVDVKAFEVDSLYGISFRVTWDGNLLFLDSAVQGDTSADDTLLFYGNLIDTTGSVYGISVSQTNQSKTLVDSRGDATLARLYFRVEAGLDVWPNMLTTVVGIDTTGFTFIDRGTAGVAFDVFYTDECTVDLLPPVMLPAEP